MSESKKSPVRENGVTKESNKGLARITSLSDPVNSLQTAFQTLINETSGLEHGTVDLKIFIRYGKAYRFTTNREVSFLFDEVEDQRDKCHSYN